mmetsp:Transcript_6798/g.11952  ORF Transcript_6798/g.11952 Transcript_6798/m.11952 type:complete len:242 (+) Transcript_6798:77-802(+)
MREALQSIWNGDGLAHAADGHGDVFLLSLQKRHPSLLRALATAGAAPDIHVAMHAQRHASRLLTGTTFLSSPSTALPDDAIPGSVTARVPKDRSHHAAQMTSFEGGSKKSTKNGAPEESPPPGEEPKKKKRNIFKRMKDKFKRKKNKTKVPETTEEDNKDDAKDDEGKDGDEEESVEEQLLKEMKALREDLKAGREGAGEDPHLFIHMTPQNGGLPFPFQPSPVYAAPQVVAVPSQSGYWT